MLEGDASRPAQQAQPEMKEFIQLSITLRGRFEHQADAVAFITAAHDATDEVHSEVTSVSESRERVSVSPSGVVSGLYR